MGFLQHTVDNNMDLWHACLETEFVQNIGNGKLTKDEFMYYIIQDSIYLRRYAQVLAMGIVKADNIQDIKTFYSFLSFVNTGEGNTRVEYLHQYGLTEQQADAMAEHPVNRAYTDFMMKCAVQGNRLDILFAALPCMLSYYWIFRQLIARYPDSMNSWLAPFLADYTSDEYRDICIHWGRYTENLCTDLSADRKQQLADIFRESCQHELNFWNMKK